MRFIVLHLAQSLHFDISCTHPPNTHDTHAVIVLDVATNRHHMLASTDTQTMVDTKAPTRTNFCM